MATRPFIVKAGSVRPCPKCGQWTCFNVESMQVAEDLCEVWVECICGHDPHGFGEKLEDVWGSLDEQTVRAAIGCWNDASGHNLEVSDQPEVAHA